jgi:hypothetical protein
MSDADGEVKDQKKRRGPPPTIQLQYGKDNKLISIMDLVTKEKFPLSTKEACSLECCAMFVVDSGRREKGEGREVKEGREESEGLIMPGHGKPAQQSWAKVVETARQSCCHRRWRGPDKLGDCEGSEEGSRAEEEGSMNPNLCTWNC